MKRTRLACAAALTAALMGTAIAPASAKQVPFDQATIAELEAMP